MLMKIKTPMPEGHKIRDASFRIKRDASGQIHIRCELAAIPTLADLIYILSTSQAEQLAKAIQLMTKGEGVED